MKNDYEGVNNAVALQLLSSYPLSEPKPLVKAIAFAISLSISTAQAGGDPVQPGPDFVVNTDADPGVGACYEPPLTCSLRDALNASNANSDPSVVTISVGEPSIFLGGGVLPTVTTAITLQGSGIDLDAGPLSRIFVVDGEESVAHLTINDLGLRNGVSGTNGGAILVSDGSLTLNNSTISGSHASHQGGGIYGNAATVTIDGGSISMNTATNYGGGLFLKQSELHMTNHQLQDNFSGYGSGGFAIDGSSTARLRSTTISGNTGVRDGGGLTNSNSNLYLYDVTISGNTAYNGAGIETKDFATTKIFNSTISGNTAVFAAAIGLGGGEPTVHLYNSTVADNASNAGLGDIDCGASCYGSLVLHVNITNSILSGALSGCALIPSSYVDVNFHAVNLMQNASDCGVPAGPDLLEINPHLSLLGSNGGPTDTLIPLPGSPVINAGDSENIPEALGIHDQRGPGFDRISFGTVDLGSVEFGPTPQPGPDFVVTSSNDVQDGACEYWPGHCSLREALAGANANQDPSLISFHPEIDSSTITLAGTQLTATSTITIQGGSGITLDGAGQSRLMLVHEANLYVHDLTFTNGYEQSGGALHVNDSKLQLIDSSISGNTAVTEGGGILFASGYLSVSIQNSTISDNVAMTGKGGGLKIGGSAKVDVRYSTVSGNSAGQDGGGVALNGDGTRFSATYSTFSGNIAGQDGGGFSTDAAGISLANSTVSGNTAGLAGGGIAGIGGYAYSPQTTLHHVTLSDNSASTGGGIFGGRFFRLSLEDSVIANSTNSDCLLTHQTQMASLAGVNLLENPAGCLTPPDSPQVISGDPQLEPLGDNGGPTLTHLPSPDSLLIGAGGESCAVHSFDQRGLGFPRTVFRVDIGAIETDLRQNRLFESSFEAHEQANRPPSFPNVNLLPEFPHVNNDLFCEATGSVDPDGDDLTFFYEWYIDGELNGAVTTSIMDSSLTAVGNEISCEVLVSDGELTTNWVSSPIRVIKLEP